MNRTRLDLVGLGLLLVIFTWFTSRGMTMFFSGDDMMNMYGAWDQNWWQVIRAHFLVWEPASRPAGTAVYKLFYGVFGFHPRPLYVFCWILLAANVVVAYRLLREVTEDMFQSLTALSLILVHGTFGDLYYSAGTIYDRLCFFFSATSLIAYFRFRRHQHRWSFAAVCILSILAMDSKESGVAVVALMFCCEVLFFLPNAWHARALRTEVRQIAPLFGTLALVSALFVLGRVQRTPELSRNPAYTPHASGNLWLSHVAHYLSVLTYNPGRFSMLTAGLVIAATAALAVLARNRTMLFGWLFFVIAVTPVALIEIRPGYVLYLPALGLGLFLAAFIAQLITPIRRFGPPAEWGAFALITLTAAWLHASHWDPVWDPHNSPEWRLTQQFRREYPSLAPKSRLLFVSDDFPKSAFDLMFNIRMLYHDKSIVVKRLQGPSNQQPDPKHPWAFDRIFVSQAGRYSELDPTAPAESIRLNILRNVAVGREMDIARADHSAYVVSGLRDLGGGENSCWTAPKAEFKFKLPAAPAVFTSKFYIPDFVAQPANRTLSVLVSGKEVGSLILAKVGINEVSFPVPAGLIQDNGFTFVEMNVDKPYKDSSGIEYGVVLVRAGFEAASARVGTAEQVSIPGPEDRPKKAG